MDNFKPTKYFVENNLITISDRHLRRKCKAYYENENVNYIKRSKNKNNSDLWLIEESSIHLIGKRIRKKKQDPKPESYFNTEVSINFNDRSDYAFYSTIVKLFRECTNFDLVYKIEKTSDNNYSYHLHMGVNGSVKTVKQHIEYIVKQILQRNCNKYYEKKTGEHKSSVRVRKLVDEDAFVDYISKGYDRLGGDFPIYVFS